MINRRFPNYPDDTDYNTNAPSYLDDLARKQKLIELLSKRIWDYDQELGRRFDEWDQNLEDFPEDVKALLKKWLVDGTLEHIINHEVLGNKADKSFVDNEFEKVVNQLVQIVQNHNDLETKKLDRNENESISKAMLNQELKEELNNGVFEFILNTSEIENTSVTQSKLNVEGYLPKTIIYTRGGHENLETDIKVHSDYISLPVGTIIKTINTGFQFSLRYENIEIPPTISWEHNHVITKPIPVMIIGKKTDTTLLSDEDVNLFSNYIQVLTQETGVTKEEHDKDRPIHLNFEYGFFTGTTGINDDAERTIRVRTVDFITIPKNSVIRLKDNVTVSYAIYREGDSSFLGGWIKEPVHFNEEVRIRVGQKFDDNQSVKDSLIFFKENIEIVTEETFIRGKDVETFTKQLDFIDYNPIYPLHSVWGYEYMFSWYDKLRKNEAVKMVWAGDSTTLNGGLEVDYTRSELGKKLLTLAGYDESLITSINAGHGTQHTGNWLGGVKDEDKRTPNGFLDEDMQENPDLYIFAYGFNDGSNSHFSNLTWEERIDRFEENLNEGLERIRGSMYNKSADDMAIILTTPIAAYDEVRGNTPKVWNDKIKPIIQKACRDYHCAFVDITARQYDHGFSSSWSTNGDLVHPNETANVDYMSMFDDLIIPRLLHK